MVTVLHSQIYSQSRFVVCQTKKGLPTYCCDIHSKFHNKQPLNVTCCLFFAALENILPFSSCKLQIILRAIMPRKRYEKVDIVCTYVDGSWICGVCGSAKGKTRKDCERHQGSCFRQKQTIEIDLNFGRFPRCPFRSQ